MVHEGKIERRRSERRWLRGLLLWLTFGVAGCDCGGDDPDNAAPKLVLVEPSEDQAINARPTLQVDAVDPDVDDHVTSGVDPASVLWKLGDEDVSGDVEASGGEDGKTYSFRYRPKVDLPDGKLKFEVSIADRAKNRAELTAELIVDTRAPEISAVSPSEGGDLADSSAGLEFRVIDSGSGIDASTLEIKVSDQPYSGELDQERLRLSAPMDGWKPGPLAVQIELRDKAGNQAKAEFVYTVPRRLLARARATPSMGDAPLMVLFSPVSEAETAIETYEWDFEGDGTFEVNETVGNNQRFTYTKPGDYEAVLRVTQIDGKQASASVKVTVNNKPPTVTAEARPSNGTAPLEVEFRASASDSDQIASYEWDFESDGTYDAMSTSSATVRHTFMQDGTYQAKLKVTDKAGATTEISPPTIEVRVRTGAPSVTANANPTSGKAPLKVNLSGSATDPNRMTISEWAWDFDGDGTYDHTDSTASTTHEYTRAGTHYARLRATTADGDSNYDVVQIQVEPVIALKVMVDTIDLALQESTSIETTLTGDLRMGLQIETPDGELVRELQSLTERSSGTYTETWNGKDRADKDVAEGQYRAVALYELNGEMKRLDLALTSGGEQSSPMRSAIPPKFAPLAGKPLVIDYTLERASEVTAFMGLYDVNTRLITFMQREERGRGTHTVVWNGENSEGQLVHPSDNDSFLFGVFAYAMPDNAIFVRNAVHVSGASASPSIYDPTALTADSKQAKSSVAFSLNRAGAVELTVYDADSGALLRRQVIEGLEMGAGQVEWDGKTSKDQYVAPGRYRLGVAGINAQHARTTTVYTLQRVYY